MINRRLLGSFGGKTVGTVLMASMLISTLAVILLLPLKPAHAASSLVQTKSKSWFGGAGVTESVTLTNAVSANNLLAVVVAWQKGNLPVTSIAGNSNIFSVIDTRIDGTVGALNTYYVKAASAGSTTVTVTWSADPGFGYLAVHEVSGLDTTAPLEGHATNRQASPGSGANALTSTSVTATTSGDYIFGATFNENGSGTTSAGTGFTFREHPDVWTGTEDQIKPAAGSVAATFTSSDAFGTFLTGVAAFKPAIAGPPDTTAPSVPTNLVATAVSTSQINLTWTASTDNVGVTGYKIFRDSTQITTTAGTSFSNTGLNPSTTYSYTVSAYDAALNESGQSTSAQATTQAPAFDFSLSNGGNKSVVAGSAVNNSVTATLLSGATQNVSFTTSGLPAGTTASYNPASCSPTCATTLTLTTSGSTPVGNSTITVTGTAGATTHNTAFTLTVTGAADTTAPVVTMTAPANNAIVAGTTTAVSATASDNVGVVGVQFTLDGVNLGSEDTTSPYSVTWNTTTASAGAHALAARARDAAGNSTTATNANVTVDNQAPTGTIMINGGAAATNSRNVTLTLSATDAFSSVTQMRISNTTTAGTAEAYATTKAWTLTTGTGMKTVYVQYKDALGNWSGNFSNSLMLDTTAPTISAVTSSNITNNSANINWTTNEAATSQVEYGLTTSYGMLTTVDANLVTTHQSTLTSLASNTTYNYRVRSKDAAGNEKLGTNATFKTLAGPPDTTAPSIPTNLAANAVSATQVNLAWTASTDNVAVTGYKVFRNAVQVATVASGTSYSNTGLTPSTSYDYSVSAYDAANNNSAQSTIVSATTPADTTPPTISISSPTNNATIFGTVAILASNVSDDVGVAGVTFKLDGANIGAEITTLPYSTNLNTTLYADGNHVLTAVARDTSNNTATSSPVTVVINNTTPPPSSIPTLVQNLHTGTNSINEVGNNFMLTLPNPTLANNALIVALTYKHSATRTIQITDNMGTNVYTAGPTTNNGTMASKIYYALGVAAGTQVLTVTFDGTVQNFQAIVSEFYNVAGASAFDGSVGTASAVNPNVAAGSFTPATDGDLIYQYAVNTAANVISFNHTVTSAVAGSNFTLLSSDAYGFAAQYQVQTTHATVNPTINITTSGADPYITLALALKSAANGTAPAAGIRIVHVTHIHTEASSQKISVPSTGNLMVVSTTYPTDQGYSISGITDSNGNSYTKVNPAPNTGHMFYTPTAANTSLNMVMTINGSVAIPFVIYDITGAANAAFDKMTFTTQSGQSTPQQDIIDAPVITPSTPNGLVMTSFPVGTGPISGVFGAGQMFDSVFYTGQTDCSGCMDSADGYSHIYNTDLSTIHFNWHVHNDGSVTDGAAMAIAFKSAGH